MGHSINHYTRKVTTKRIYRHSLMKLQKMLLIHKKRTATMEILQYMK